MIRALAAVAAAAALSGCGATTPAAHPTRAGTTTRARAPGPSATSPAAPGPAAATTAATTAATGAGTTAATGAGTTAAAAASQARPGAQLPAVLPMPPGTPAQAARSIQAFVAAAQRTHEAPTPIARQTVLGGWPSPLLAVRDFAATYVNWAWTNLALKLRLLAASSVGQARSTMALAAAGAAHDYELQHGEISNSGTVEAVAPIPRSPNQYLVVTRERTTAANNSAYTGLQPAWHVTLATVTPVQDGLWVISSWQPQN